MQPAIAGETSWRPAKEVYCLDLARQTRYLALGPSLPRVASMVVCDPMPALDQIPNATPLGDASLLSSFGSCIKANYRHHVVDFAEDCHCVCIAPLHRPPRSSKCNRNRSCDEITLQLPPMPSNPLKKEHRL